MKISGRIKRKKSVIVTPERVRLICDIILKHSERLEISAETLAKTTISFESIEELLEYDNFKPRRIVALEIAGYIGYSRIISVEIGDFNLSPITNYGSTVRCSYNLSSVDAETIFVSDFETWYQKSKCSYWLIGKFSFNGLFFVPSAFITLIRFISGAEVNIDLANGVVFAAVIAITLLACVFMYLVKLLDVHLLGNLFPAVAFLWGEEVKRNEKWEQFRINLVWCVIIGILIGLVTNYFYDTLKGIIA